MASTALAAGGCSTSIVSAWAAPPATLRPLLRAFEDKARLIDLLSQMAEERGVPALIVVPPLYTLFPSRMSGSVPFFVGAALIAAIGFYDGFFGPGTGSLLIFVFVRCYGYDFLHAGASARVVNVAANAAALSYFASHGLVLWHVGAAMAAWMSSPESKASRSPASPDRCARMRSSICE